jgi:hypothetical protein
MLMQVYESEIRAYIEEQYQDARAAIERQKSQAETGFVAKTSELRQKAEADKRQARSDTEATLAPLSAEVTRLSAEYRSLVNAITVEVDGRANSQLAGEGPRSRQKRAQATSVKELLDAATAKLNGETVRVNRQLDDKIASVDAILEADLGELSDRRQAAESQFDRNLRELDSKPRDGFLNEYTALRAVSWKEPLGALQFLALFTLIESMVIVVKLVTGKTDYHMFRATQWAKRENELSKEISTNNAERRARERTEKEDDHTHAQELAKIAAAERARRLQELNDHLTDLKQRGASDEDVARARKRLLRNGGVLRAVG